MSLTARGRHGVALGLGVLAMLGLLLALGGCNTAAGFGQDVSNAGHAVTNAADKAKQGL